MVIDVRWILRAFMGQFDRNKGDIMLIQVVYKDNHYDYVKDFMLECLLASQQVVKFKRSSGWVTVGLDPVRQKREGYSYRGIERRSASLQR